MDRNQDCFNQDVIMTKITVFKKDNLIVGYQIKGHSGFAQEGKDIVCSAISTATQMTLLGLTQVLNLKVEENIQDGFLSVLLQKNDWQNSFAQVLLETMEKSLEDISKNYAGYVKMEVRKDVY